MFYGGDWQSPMDCAPRDHCNYLTLTLTRDVRMNMRRPQKKSQIQFGECLTKVNFWPLRAPEEWR
jgi:hypothetical protein